MTRMQALATATDAGIIFSSKDHSDSSVARSLRRAVERGALVRLVRGAFFDSSSWSRLSLEERHRLAVFATASTLPRPTVFSHESAAVLCGIRMLGTWKQSVTTTVDPSSGHRSSPQVRRVQAHLHSHDIVDVGGILCTSPARTITDLSCTLPFVEAVAAADSALHRKRRHQLLTLDELADCAARAAHRRGYRQLQRVLGFATPLSDSVQESRSRVLIHELGFPAPVLQQPWRDVHGPIGETDFWWPAYNVAGEFDGLVKYLDRVMRGNRTAEEVVVDEKRREDRIRRLGPTMARWVTAELKPASQLRSILLAAGLPMVD